MKLSRCKGAQTQFSCPLLYDAARRRSRENLLAKGGEPRFPQRREDALLTREPGSTIAYLGRESDAVRMLTNKSRRNCAARLHADFYFHATSVEHYRASLLPKDIFTIFDRGIDEYKMSRSQGEMDVSES